MNTFFAEFFSFILRAIRANAFVGAYITLCLGSLPAYADSYKVSIADIPSAPYIIEQLRALEAANPGLKFDVSATVFVRSIDAVIKDHTADFHLPLLRPPNESRLPYDMATTSFFNVPFMLYENKNKPLDINNLQQYKIHTEKAHINIFDFPLEQSPNIESSLRMVDAGRIDGFIFAAYETDPILEQTGLKNIHRRLYKVFDVSAVIPKGSKNGPLDRTLSKAMEAAKNTPAYKAAVNKMTAKYKGPDWQP